MYFFARQWRTLSKFSCFAMEDSHRRHIDKRMLRNSGGLSLLRGRLGVQVAVDNHTINDSLRAEGWDVTKRSMRGQGPLTVQQLARWARKRAFSDLNYVHTLSQLFTRRKQQQQRAQCVWTVQGKEDLVYYGEDVHARMRKQGLIRANLARIRLRKGRSRHRRTAQYE